MAQNNNLNTSKKTQVLVLGTYHFANGGDHAVEVDVADITTPEKQSEISEVVNKLANFKPTKIAVESPVTSSEKLNDNYLMYCSMKNNIKSSEIAHRNEIVQLGFRLASQLNHSKVYPIDHGISLPFENMINYAEKHNQDFHKYFWKEVSDMGQKINEMQKNSTVGEILCYLNNPQRIAQEHSNMYLNIAPIGAGDTYYGANYLTAWYDRNIRIFGNLLNIADPEDRILVIYGAGHCAILSEFVKSYNNMELIDTLQYL